ncbi:MAG: hypothetical protein RMJ15_00490 [Nitrososphaerota archaeon]|nr:hypothetical protein [Candidatus Bathyarchaeota archaeon]MDW8022212.1 hypothetical protein [Nitrososphaerota archaeon]
MADWVTKALTRRVRQREIPPSQRLVYGVKFALAMTLILSALEIAHMAFLGRWNSEIFAAITGLTGTVSGILIAQKPRGGIQFMPKKARKLMITRRIAELRQEFQINTQQLRTKTIQSLQELFNIATSLAKGEVKTQTANGKTEKITPKQRQM